MSRPAGSEESARAGKVPGRGSDSHIGLEYPALAPAARTFLEGLVKLQLQERAPLEQFLKSAVDRLAQLSLPDTMGKALLQAGLLTPYQLDRVLAGTPHGLVLGNYRMLERLGAGSMGVVFLAEHMLLKRRVAIKVLPVDDSLPLALLERFFGEMRLLADLHHPNIVMAFDAGRLPPPNPSSPALHYLVMELVSGGDIEQYVIDRGPLPISQACDMIRQAACGLQEAHDHHLIHRDIKPSNLLLTTDGQVKLVDFGLARQFHSNLTDPSCLLGSVEFMAPEQSIDPSAVEGKADIYGLGATLFWMITGQTPYPEERSIARALRRLQCDRPRRIREFRPDAPVELDALIDRMLARDPGERPAMPATVMNTLTRFAAPSAPPWEIYELDQPDEEPAAAAPVAADNSGQVLIVAGDPASRASIRQVLEPGGCVCGEAPSGAAGLGRATNEPFGVVLLNLDLPDIHGYEVCSRLRVAPPRPHLKIIVYGQPGDKCDLARALGHGADDCLTLPLDIRQLNARVQYLLRQKDAQDRSDLMARHLALANRQLEDSLRARDSDVREAQDALVFGLAKVLEARDGETAGHCRRLQLYCRTLAETLTDNPVWAGMLTPAFRDTLERSIPLHDLGKLGLPEAVLAKRGALTKHERTLIETHPAMGAGLLEAITRKYRESLGFLTAATLIVRHHHERFDGMGYPDQLAGDVIPPAARMVALADVYDALRRDRSYKAALFHDEAVRCIVEESEGQFDPNLVQAFARCHEQFKTIYEQIRD